MPSRGLDPGARLVAACVRAMRQRLASVRGHERTLAALRGFRREVAARTCARLRRETRVQLQARYSHLVADDTWCTGTAQATDADTTARPHITHNHGGAYESL